LPSNAACFLLFGRHLGGVTAKYKISLKIKSPSSSFVVVFKIKSALNPAIKNNKTGNPQNFFRWREIKKSATSRKNHLKPQNPASFGQSEQKQKFFFSVPFLSFCIYDRWSFLIFPSIYAPFLDHLTVL
jgi:hypothetical protein